MSSLVLKGGWTLDMFGKRFPRQLVRAVQCSTASGTTPNLFQLSLAKSKHSPERVNIVFI